jgi:hypothetical protein
MNCDKCDNRMRVDARGYYQDDDGDTACPEGGYHMVDGETRS